MSKSVCEPDRRGHSGKICKWCGKFMKGHGYQDWTDAIEINLHNCDGPVCTPINYDRSQEFGYHVWRICPDCGKAVLELKEQITRKMNIDKDSKSSNPKAITDERFNNEINISFLKQKIKELEGVER